MQTQQVPLQVCRLAPIMLLSQALKLLYYSITYLTGPEITSHVCTKTEIHFIAQDYSYSQEVSMHSVSTVQCELVTFVEGILPIL